MDKAQEERLLNKIKNRISKIKHKNFDNDLLASTWGYVITLTDQFVEEIETLIEEIENEYEITEDVMYLLAFMLTLKGKAKNSREVFTVENEIKFKILNFLQTGIRSEIQQQELLLISQGYSKNFIIKFLNITRGTFDKDMQRIGIHLKKKNEFFKKYFSDEVLMPYYPENGGCKNIYQLLQKIFTLELP